MELSHPVRYLVLCSSDCHSCSYYENFVAGISDSVVLIVGCCIVAEVDTEYAAGFDTAGAADFDTVAAADFDTVAAADCYSLFDSCNCYHPLYYGKLQTIDVPV